MRLLNTHTEELHEEEVSEEQAVLWKYAILSHTWGKPRDEVLYKDIRKGRKEDIQAKIGYLKIAFACRQARKDGLDYAWIDTCCINKHSSEELAESINSMFRWYQNAEVCYVYLSDHSHIPQQADSGYGTLTMNGKLARSPECDGDSDDTETPSANDSTRLIERAKKKRTEARLESHIQRRLRESFRNCRWFKRGWTLQELLAPSHIKFYDRNWNLQGEIRKELATTTKTPNPHPGEPFETIVSRITGIHEDALVGRRPISSYSVAQRMCWAADRETGRKEDRAYSLLGIFDISIPIIYGEGPRAFQRLQEELLRVYSDQTIFAWSTKPGKSHRRHEEEQVVNCNLLASSPNAFRGCGRIVPAERYGPQVEYHVTNTDIRLTMPIFLEHRVDKRGSAPEVHVRAVLGCRLEGNDARVLIVELVPIPETSDVYFVRGGESRVMEFDHYKAARRCSNKTITILRRMDMNRSSAHSESQHTTVICRLKASVSKQFKPWISAVRDYSDAWNPDFESFVLDRPTERGCCGKLDISIRDVTYARLSLQRRSNGTFWVAFVAHEDSSRLWMSITSLSPLPMNIHKYVVMVATVEPRRLLNGTSIVLEIETVRLTRVFYPLARFIWKNAWFRSYTVLLWGLLTALQLPIGVLIPLVMVMVARKTAYQRSNTEEEQLLETGEVVLLSVAMPIAYLVNFFIVLEFEAEG